MCGSCGKPMRTNYHTDQRPCYECSSRADRLTTPTCRSVAASYVDDAVAAALLAALAPEQVALALSAADQVADRHHRVSRAAQLAVQRARYEADQAERAYHDCEPENRLVARTLESRWEAKLTALAGAEAAREAATEALPPLPSRANLEKLATDLPALWDAHTTSDKDRKRLLRTLISDVTLLPEPDRSKVRIGIRWHTGAADELTVDGRGFDIDAVQRIRHVHKIPTPSPYADGEISVADVAGKLGCSTGAVYDWIKKGRLNARRGGGNRLCIPWDDHVEAACQTLIDQSAHLNPDPAVRRRKPPTPVSSRITSPDTEIGVAEAATRLSCSIGVVYYWIESGHLGARRGPGNRLRIGWNAQVETDCRNRIDQSGHLNPKARRSRPQQRR